MSSEEVRRHHVYLFTDYGTKTTCLFTLIAWFFSTIWQDFSLVVDPEPSADTLEGVKALIKNYKVKTHKYDIYIWL